MSESEGLKRLVRDKYGALAARDNEKDQGDCCCADAGCGTDMAPLVSGYEEQQGYNPDADLGLGCGLPVDLAGLHPGDTLIDLGAGAGNDCFIARAAVGESGRVIGIDMTPEMIAKARRNAEKSGFDNVEFRLGELENLPVEDNLADVVVSNCVFNLVPDKARAFRETWRVLKPGGHFSIADIVTLGELPHELQRVAELYTGCIAGAMDRDAYLQLIRAAGFKAVRVQRESRIAIPRELLMRHGIPAEIAGKLADQTTVMSITVTGEKR